MVFDPEQNAIDVAKRQYLHFRQNKDKPQKEKTWFNPYAKKEPKDIQMSDEYLKSMFDKELREQEVARHNAAMQDLSNNQTHTGVNVLSAEEIEHRNTQFPSLLDG